MEQNKGLFKELSIQKGTHSIAHAMMEEKTTTESTDGPSTPTNHASRHAAAAAASRHDQRPLPSPDRALDGAWNRGFSYKKWPSTIG